MRLKYWSNLDKGTILCLNPSQGGVTFFTDKIDCSTKYFYARKYMIFLRYTTSPYENYPSLDETIEFLIDGKIFYRKIILPKISEFQIII